MKWLFLASLALCQEIVEPEANGSQLIEEELETEPLPGKNSMKHVQIAMVNDVVDSTTFLLLSGGDGPKTIRLGNVVPDNSAAGLKSARELVQKSMIVYRVWPDHLQTDGTVLADVWTAEGRHLGLELVGAGFKETGMSTPWTTDILQVAADQEKQKSYQALNDALTEQSMAEKEEIDRERREKTEPIPWSGVFAFGVFGAIVVFSFLATGSKKTGPKPRLPPKKKD